MWLVGVPAAIISFALGRVIWPEMAGVPGPSAALLPHFIFVSALESVAFGLGVGFLLFGWGHLAKAGADKLAKAAFISIAWFLVSWWPHDNMHRVNGMDNFEGLIRIEYTFHVTLIVGGIILAAYFWRQLHRTPESRP